MHNRRVGTVRQVVQRAKPDPDVLQRDGLQFATPPELGFIQHQCALGGLPLPRELVQVTRAVEVLDCRHPAGVRVGTQVAPGFQAAQRVLHLFLGRLDARAAEHRLGHVLWPQVHYEPLLGRSEHRHHFAVQRRQRSVQVGERPRTAPGLSLPRVRLRGASLRMRRSGAHISRQYAEDRRQLLALDAPPSQAVMALRPGSRSVALTPGCPSAWPRASPTGLQPGTSSCPLVPTAMSLMRDRRLLHCWLVRDGCRFMGLYGGQALEHSRGDLRYAVGLTGLSQCEARTPAAIPADRQSADRDTNPVRTSLPNR